MKTLSFHEVEIGRTRGGTLLRLDTATDGVAIAPGLNLIVAPNGYGKSTLLQTLGGLLAPLKGAIRADGQPFDPSKTALYVSEYLTFPKFVYPPEWVEFMSGRTWSPELERELRPWIEGYSLEPKLGSYLGRMSQGERRKVTWLGAHASRKPLVLLDEPLDGLDLLGIRAAREMIQAWKAAGRTLLIVAHQLGEVLDLSDEVFLIDGAAKSPPGEAPTARKLVPWSKWAGGPSSRVSVEEFRKKVLAFYSR